MELVQRDNIFNQTSPLKVDRNAFDLTHKVIGAFDMGKLTPVSCAEVYPNDTFKTQIQTKLIFNTMKFPIYQNLKASFYDFGVAYRNLWDKWRNYYTGGRKGNFSAQEPKVNLNCKSNIKGSLFDYLGFPLQSQLKGDVFVSAFPFIAYDFIYFWNFINPEIQENIVYNIQDKTGVKSSTTGNLHCTDELNLFYYNCEDFYIVNEDGIPLYTRMLAPYGYKNSKPNVSIKDNTALYGKSDRYSYTGSSTVGLIVDDGGLKPYFNDYTNYTGNYFISNADYRNLVNIGFLYNVNWQRDYFTSAHLSQQQGTPMSIPLTTNVTASDPNPIGTHFADISSYAYLTDSIGNVVRVGSHVQGGIGDDYNIASATPATTLNGSLKPAGLVGTTQKTIDYFNSLIFNATTSSFSNNDLRLVWQINMIKESVLFNKKNFEYASYLRFFFGRGPSTSELQQPFYVGSFDLDIYVGEVMQTSQTTQEFSLGERGGIASVIDRDYIDPYTFDEIGLNMIVMFISPSNIFQNSQGINRQWLRNDRFDYYNPLLSRIGLQDIQNREVYAQGTSADTQVFGYTPAFNELRYIPDLVVSDMRDTLNAWHMSRTYDKLPVLNSDYLLCRPTKRIYNVQQSDTPNITGIINIVCTAYRDMPELAIPELIDHRY